jgi:hypothetical protein
MEIPILNGDNTEKIGVLKKERKVGNHPAIHTV